MERFVASRVDSVVNLSKRRGFVFPSSDIYGAPVRPGTTAAGSRAQENVRRQWWQHMVRGRDDVVGIDSSVILALGCGSRRVTSMRFVDPLTECKQPQALAGGSTDRSLRREARPRTTRGSVEMCAQLRDQGSSPSLKTSTECSAPWWGRWRMKAPCTTCDQRPPRGSSSTT